MINEKNIGSYLARHPELISGNLSEQEEAEEDLIMDYVLDDEEEDDYYRLHSW